MRFLNSFNSIFGLFSILVFFICSLTIVLNIQGFWHDEIHTLALIRGLDVYPFQGSDFVDITRFESVNWYKSLLGNDNFYINFCRNIIHEGHPPLYYLLLKLWTYVFGFNELGLRSFSVFTSSISLIVFSQIINFILGKNKNVYTLLLAISPFFVYYSFEARSYSIYFLFALLTFFYFLKELYNSSINPTNYSLRLFLIYSLLLLFSHYYGIFLYIVLISIIGVKYLMEKKYVKIPLLFTPIILFSPWLYIIRQQTTVHINHWTDGSLDLIDSIYHFLTSHIELLNYSSFDSDQQAFLLIFIGLILILINYTLSENFRLKYVLLFFLCIIFYGCEIIIFDIVLDHHTIAIVRYYFPLLIIILLGIIYCIENGRFRIINLLVLFLIFYLNLSKSYSIITAESEKKQMYKEVSRYIEHNYDPNEFKIVVSPNGPSTLGLAYYLNDNFMIKGVNVDELCDHYLKDSTLIVEQKLGVNYEPWNIQCENEFTTITKINFVGLDLVEKK